MYVFTTYFSMCPLTPELGGIVAEAITFALFVYMCVVVPSVCVCNISPGTLAIV